MYTNSKKLKLRKSRLNRRYHSYYCPCINAKLPLATPVMAVMYSHLMRSNKKSRMPAH